MTGTVSETWDTRRIPARELRFDAFFSASSGSRVLRSALSSLRPGLVCVIYAHAQGCRPDIRSLRRRLSGHSESDAEVVGKWAAGRWRSEGAAVLLSVGELPPSSS